MEEEASSALPPGIAYRDPAFLGMIQPKQQIQRSGLALTGRPDECHDLSRLRPETGVFVHPLFILIGKIHMLHIGPDPCLLRFPFHFPGLRVILCGFPGQFDHLHDPLCADSRGDQRRKQTDNAAERSSQGGGHGHEHGHGAVTDLSLPEAVYREPVTGVSDDLSHQRGNDHGAGLKLVLLQRQTDRILLEAVKFFLDLSQHAESLDKLQILKRLLIKNRPVAGKILIVPLKIPCLFYSVPGHKQRNRGSCRAIRAMAGSFFITMEKAPTKLMQTLTALGKKLRILFATMPASPLTR